MNRLITTAMIVGTALASHAWASSIGYTFTQTGFSDGLGDPGTLSGSFVATPEADGTIQTGDVSSFTATFQETETAGSGAGKVDSFVFNQLNDLSFDTTNAGSLEFSSGSLASGIIICSGGGDVNDVCEPHLPIGVATSSRGFFEDLPGFGSSVAQQAATVTALGSTSAAPEPGTLLIFGTGLTLLLAGGVRRRRAGHRQSTSGASLQACATGLAAT